MRSGGGMERRPADDRGQAEVIGVVLVLAMTLVGATVALAFGASALNDARASSNEEGVRNALTQLDSRAAQVALGDSSSQHVRLAEGSYNVDPDAGSMTITHVDYNGSGEQELLFNDSLGEITYENGESTIAYQGGGVWESGATGSTMISPPEFHYRGATLTLPIVRVVGSDSGSGSVTARVSTDSTTRRIYPNESADYDETGAPYRNPVNAGNVSVKIQSTYYQAWADYFETRSDGEITLHNSNETVEVLLFTPNSIGNFDMPDEEEQLSIHQLGDEHPISAFNLTLIAANPGGNGNGGGPEKFKDMEWSFSTGGVEEFEIEFSGSPCANDPDFVITLYHDNGTGDTVEWQNSSDPNDNSDVTIDCDEDELTIELMGMTSLEYQGTPANVDFDQHEIDDNEGNGTYVIGDTENIGFLVNHYLEIVGPSAELTVNDDGGGASVHAIAEESSFGYLEYSQGGGPRFITYLHITENRVIVEFE